MNTNPARNPTIPAPNATAHPSGDVGSCATGTYFLPLCACDFGAGFGGGFGFGVFFA
jgi:hypothetical protein